MKASTQLTYPALALNWLLRGFFRLLYNQFAWTYDWIARVVSLDLWNDWILTVIPFLQGDPILEIGHGTGHLQLALFELKRVVFGLDLSSSMGKITSKRLRHTKIHPMLTRGTADSIPFPDQCFTSIVATFPSEYIANLRTLEESWRVLQVDGCLVILPYAWITGDRWFERLAGWLFRITDQTPENPTNGEVPSGIFGEWVQALIKSAQQLGFHISIEDVSLQSSQVMIIIAKKTEFPAK